MRGDSVRRSEDPLAPARGIIFGVLFSLAAVAAIVAACFLVAFLLSNPPVAAIVIGLTFLLVVIALTRDDS